MGEWAEIICYISKILYKGTIKAQIIMHHDLSGSRRLVLFQTSLPRFQLVNKQVSYAILLKRQYNTAGKNSDFHTLL